MVLRPRRCPDFTHLKFPDFIDKDKVVAALKKINYKLKPMDIVLFTPAGINCLAPTITSINMLAWSPARLNIYWIAVSR